MHLDPVTIKPMNVPYSLASSYYYMAGGWVGGYVSVTYSTREFGKSKSKNYCLFVLL